MIWADDADECHERLMNAIAATEEFLKASRRGRLVLGAPRGGHPDERRADEGGGGGAAGDPRRAGRARSG